MGVESRYSISYCSPSSDGLYYGLSAARNRLVAARLPRPGEDSREETSRGACLSAALSRHVDMVECCQPQWQCSSPWFDDLLSSSGSRPSCDTPR